MSVDLSKPTDLPIEAKQRLEEMWPVYWRIAGSNHPQIAMYDMPVYESAQRLVKALFRQAYPLMPADFCYDLCVQSGELLPEAMLKRSWIERCNSDY